MERKGLWGGMRVAAGLLGATVTMAGVTGAGVAAAGTGPVPAGQSMLAAGGPITATSPTTVAMTTANGTAANGIQVSITAPKQLPIPPDLLPGNIPTRELDVVVKDVSGASGGAARSVSTSVTFTGFDMHTGAIRYVPALHPVTTAIPETVTDQLTVSVPAGGETKIVYQISMFALGDPRPVGIAAVASGSSASVSIPRTQLSVSMTGVGSGGQLKAGVPTDFAVVFTNGTDLTFHGIDLPIELADCTPSAECAAPKDFQLQTGTGHSPVALTQNGYTVRGYLASGMTVAANGVTTQIGRLTLPVSSPATRANLNVSPTIAKTPFNWDLTVIPASVPAPATKSVDTPTDTATPTDATPSTAGTPTDPGTPTASGTADVSAAPAGAGSGSSGSNATILLAVGLLVLCAGCIGGYFYLRRRGQA